MIPNFGRLKDVAVAEDLKGAQVERPLVMPVQLSLIPDAVASVSEASNALQHACYVCTLLSNQHGLVRDSYALRVGLITHLFLRVLPVPLPPGRADHPAECFWASATLTADTQGTILRWLGTLCRHFAAASLAVPLGRSFDAARMLVFASIAALVDAVLRAKACDTPTILSTHYGGHVAGAAGAFALDMRHLERESEAGQFLHRASPPAGRCSSTTSAARRRPRRPSATSSAGSARWPLARRSARWSCRSRSTWASRARSRS